MKEFLKQVWWGNTAQMYFVVLGEILLVWIILRLFKQFIVAAFKRITRRTKSTTDDAVVAAAEKYIIPYLYFLVNYIIIEQLNITPHATHLLKVVMAVITAYYFIRFINLSLRSGVVLYMRRKDETQQRITQLNGVLLMITILVWTCGILMLIENLGYNITTIITGLGIGGIAIALAAQNILTDLFSYFVIFFDKPFEVGDVISVNNLTGTVEHIGIKTSHIRSVSGEQLIMPNAELVKSTIKNIKRLQRRGVTFKLNLRYDTPEEKLKVFPALIQSIIEPQPHVTFDRCHFTTLGDYALTYEVLYYIDSSDYKLYLDIQQNIYLEVLNTFDEQGIDFAFPGQTFILQHPPEAGNKEAK